MSDSVPVACGCHYRLARLREICRLSFVDAGRARVDEGRIADIVTTRGGEFVLLTGAGDPVRLDGIRDTRQV